MKGGWKSVEERKCNHVENRGEIRSGVRDLGIDVKRTDASKNWRKVNDDAFRVAWVSCDMGTAFLWGEGGGMFEDDLGA
jgi:hypothetical protein